MIEKGGGWWARLVWFLNLNERKERMSECKLRNGRFLEKEERKNLIEIQKVKTNGGNINQ